MKLEQDWGDTIVKKLFSLIAVLFIVLSLAGCVPCEDESCEPEPEVLLTDEEVFELLEDAAEFEIEEAIVSIGKHYTIYADGKKIGTVTGKVITAFGDTFTFETVNGTLISYEDQVKRWGVKLNRAAIVYDAEDNIIGYIGEETETKLFSIGYWFHFYDAEKNEIGTSDEVNISVLKKNNFYNNDGELIYKVEKQFTLLADKYLLTVEDSSEVSATMAIFMVCIEDAIHDANSD